MISSLILPKVYRDFLGEHSDINLAIVEGGSQELIQRLEEDFLDMVFLPHNSSFNKKLSVYPAARLEVSCCVSVKNPLAKEREIDPVKLKDFPIALFEDGFFQTQQIKRWFSSYGVAPGVLFQTEQLSTMLSGITNNIAVGFMFKDVVERYSELKAIRLSEPMYVDVSLVWKKDSYSFSSMKKFREYMHTDNPFLSR
jgi:DNA-binding transcriptional LysR family regulator